MHCAGTETPAGRGTQEVRNPRGALVARGRMKRPLPVAKVVASLLGLVLAIHPATRSRAEAGPAVPADHERGMKEGLALFKEHVRPALVQHCLQCHGGKQIKGEFDLSDRKPLLDSGAIDGAGKESYLYALITHAE